MKKLMQALAVASMALFAGLPAKAQDTLQFATEAAFPPFNQRAADGSIEGFEIDLGQAMCAKINRKCEFVAQEWDGMIPGLLAKKYNAIFASMTITEERKTKINFTDKYYQTPYVFVGPEDQTVNFGDATLGGLAVGTLPGTSECYLRKHYPDASVKVFKNAENMFLDLAAKRVDIVIAEIIQADFGLLKTERGKGMSTLGDNLADAECFGDGVGIGVRKGDDALLADLNKAIRLVREDGTYGKIVGKYFDYDIYGQ